MRFFKKTKLPECLGQPVENSLPERFFMAVCPGRRDAELETFLIKASGHKAIEQMLGDAGHTNALVYPVTQETVEAIRQNWIKVSATLLSRGDYSDGTCIGWRKTPSVSSEVLTEMDSFLSPTERRLPPSAPRYLEFENTFLG